MGGIGEALKPDLKSRLLRSKHEDHGWKIDEKLVSRLQPNRLFYRCPCGWYGWVDKNMQVSPAFFSIRKPKL